MGYVSRLTRYPLRRKRLFFGFLGAAGVGTLFNVATPLVMAYIIDVVIPSSAYDLLLPYALLYLGLNGLYAVFDIAGRYGAALSAHNAIYELRKDLYISLMEKDLAFYDSNETGQLIARVTTDVTTMREFLLWGYRVIFIGVATLIGTYVMMWVISPTLTVYMLGAVPIVALFGVAFAKHVRPVFFRAREKYGRLSSVLTENIVGIKVVRSYAATEREKRRVRDENEEFRRVVTRALRLAALYQPLLPALLGVVTGVLVYVGGVSFVTGTLTYGEFVAFVSLVGMLVLPARFLSWGIGMYQRASAAAERTFYILDHKDEILDPEDPVEATNLRGEVEFVNVCFSYGDGKLILDNVSFRVRPGQIVALLGGTGSGKTTLTNLISRLYDVDRNPTVVYGGRTYRVDNDGTVHINGQRYHVTDGVVDIDGEIVPVQPPGKVLIDGIDVRRFRIRDLRRRIGVVHQDPFLFSATIRENIAFGRPDATQEEIEAAAKAARIHDFIVSLPDGYESLVGERGVALSGGQRQRVAIARALLADPTILVLDDSTSAVDARTEMLIQEALENLMRGRTTFVITHRMSTIRNADLIVVMEHGRVVEIGSHDELMALGGIYAGIHRTLAEMEMLASQTPSSEGVTAGGDS
ncbi:MAG: ABC transporter transmembrane domain-containing protein [Candidatus Thorarchaeota archaeon]